MEDFKEHVVGYTLSQNKEGLRLWQEMQIKVIQNSRFDIGGGTFASNPAFSASVTGVERANYNAIGRSI